MANFSLYPLIEVQDLLDIRSRLMEFVYPAPSPQVSSTHSFEDMTLEDIRNALNSDELWQVGNSFLRNGQFAVAQTYFNLYQEKTFSAKIEAQIGLCALMMNDFEVANVHLGKALLKEPTLSLARLWLCFVRHSLKKSRSVRAQARRLLASTEDKFPRTQAYVLLALDAVQRDDRDDFLQNVSSGLKIESDSILNILNVGYGFLKGCEEFESGEFSRACKTWSISYNLSTESWFFLPSIKRYFDSRSIEFETKIHEIGNTFDHYDLVNAKLIALKLFPEFYEAEESLTSRLDYWGSQLVGSNSYPYARYRLAICQLFLKFYEEAIENFEQARDKTPSSKLDHFRFQDLVSWVRGFLHDTPDSGRSNVFRDASGEFEDHAWRNAALGLTEDQVQQWKAMSISLETARPWLKAGIREPKVMLRWEKLEAKPVEVKEWIDVFKVEMGVALAFYAAGFRDPVLAKDWSAKFRVPAEAYLCYSKGKELSDF